MPRGRCSWWFCLPIRKIGLLSWVYKWGSEETMQRCIRLLSTGPSYVECVNHWRSTSRCKHPRPPMLPNVALSCDVT
ncbi:hypothetical protein SprV_0100343700 [Sparganum proliferum]